MAGQARFGEIGEADFSSLLEALSDTPKGRAFLAEYRRRSGPEEIETLLSALRRIEAAVGTIRDRLRPERLSEELQRVATTLQIACDGNEVEGRDQEPTWRLALVESARAELVRLSAGLGGELAPAPSDAGADQAAAEPAVPAER